MTKVRVALGQLMLQLRFTWWMITSDRTIMVYALALILLFIFLVLMQILGLAAR